MTKISQLTAASALTGDELIPIVQGGVTRKALIANLPGGSGGSGIVVEEIAYTDALRVGEPLPAIIFLKRTRFPANFANNVGCCLRDAPTADETIHLQMFLADGSDQGLVGSITIHPDRTFTRATIDGSDLDLDVGDRLLPFADASVYGASVVTELLVGVELTGG